MTPNLLLSRVTIRLQPRNQPCLWKVKVKQSHYRPGQTLRVPGGWCSRISWQSAHEGGRVVRTTHRPPLPPRKNSGYAFLLQAESTPEPEGLCQWKIQMTLSGIEPMTFRLIAQWLNQMRHPVKSLRYFFFWVVTRHMLVMVYPRFGKAHRSTTTNTRCVITQKNEDLIHTVAEAWEIC